jgi:hypothetical protein
VCSLDASSYFKLTVSCPFVEQIEMFTTKINEYFVVTSDGLTLEFWNLDGLSIIEAMVFEK